MALAGDLLKGILAGYVANMLFSRTSQAPTSSPAPAPPAAVDALRVASVQTGGSDAGAWARARLDAARAWLERLGLSAAHAADVARSLVAQWGHETASGKKEFNFNLGGWVAAKGRPFHVLSDATTGNPIRWDAFPDLATSVREHIERLRLRDRYRPAFALLVQSPASDAWVRELGRAGYYEAPQDVYAAAWAAHRRALEPLMPRFA